MHTFNSDGMMVYLLVFLVVMAAGVDGREAPRVALTATNPLKQRGVTLPAILCSSALLLHDHRLTPAFSGPSVEIRTIEDVKPDCNQRYSGPL